MISEIQQAVDTGKLTSSGGGLLEKLPVGTYVLHKSWGFGKVTALNFLLGQVTIDFKGKKGHTMQLQYAADSLTVIDPDHIYALKASDLAGVKARAQKDPVALVRQVLNSFGQRATQDQIASALVPEVLSESEFKRWFEATKKALKKDGFFTIPAKKAEPFELRAGAVSHADEYVAGFQAARQLKDQTAALELISKNIAEFTEPQTQLAAVLTAANDAAKKNVRLKTAEALSLLLTRDELAEKTGITPAPGSLTVADVLREEERNLAARLNEIPAAKMKRAMAELPVAFGEKWSQYAVGLVLGGSNRVVGDAARLFLEKGATEELRFALERAISEHSISREALTWLCKEREGEFSELANVGVLHAMIAALERELMSESRDRKLHDLLLNDKELVTDLIADATPEQLRETMRKLLQTPAIDELNKRSLLGRIIRVYPELQALVSGESDEEQEALVVSWESLEKRKLEFEELVTKKIPENTKEIGIARSYGDLRENFEFKAAKEMQRVLMRRQAETQSDLARARGTDFLNVDLSQVSIGTVVTLREVETGKTTVYTILGAWDSDPEKAIVSYLAAVAQALLGHKVGEQLAVPTENGDALCEIVGIEAYKK